mmetsp:Transcript_15113/g.41489  ORF Transcript_15113/g.41489 Transcript_15113/m.41489 type:complete len:262 (+) Transcript_15113:464-1249(+)
MRELDMVRTLLEDLHRLWSPPQRADELPLGDASRPITVEVLEPVLQGCLVEPDQGLVAISVLPGMLRNAILINSITAWRRNRYRWSNLLWRPIQWNFSSTSIPSVLLVLRAARQLHNETRFPKLGSYVAVLSTLVDSVSLKCFANVVYSHQHRSRPLLLVRVGNTGFEQRPGRWFHQTKTNDVVARHFRLTPLPPIRSGACTRRPCALRPRAVHPVVGNARIMLLAPGIRLDHAMACGCKRSGEGSRGGLVQGEGHRRHCT